MKDHIELFVAELPGPIELGEVLGDEIAAIADQVFEVAGTKIVDDGQAGVRESFLKG